MTDRTASPITTVAMVMCLAIASCADDRAGFEPPEEQGTAPDAASSAESDAGPGAGPGAGQDAARDAAQPPDMRPPPPLPEDGWFYDDDDVDPDQCIMNCAYDGDGAEWLDCDFDRLDNAAEAAAGTDPCSSDSDGDGLSDRGEIEAGSNPNVADSDMDGLTDAFEVRLGLDPVRTDSRGDGTSDGDRWFVSACQRPTETLRRWNSFAGDWSLFLDPGFEYTPLISTSNFAIAYFEHAEPVAGALVSWPGVFKQSVDDRADFTVAGLPGSRIETPERASSRGWAMRRAVLELPQSTTLAGATRQFLEAAISYPQDPIVGYPPARTTETYSTFVVDIAVQVRTSGSEARQFVKVTVTPSDRFDADESVRILLDETSFISDYGEASTLRLKGCYTARLRDVRRPVDLYFVVEADRSTSAELALLESAIGDAFDELAPYADVRAGIVAMTPPTSAIDQYVPNWRTTPGEFEADVEALMASDNRGAWGLEAARRGIERLHELPEPRGFRDDALVALVWIGDEAPMSLEVISGAASPEARRRRETNFAGYFRRQVDFSAALIPLSDACSSGSSPSDLGSEYQSVVESSTFGTALPTCRDGSPQMPLRLVMQNLVDSENLDVPWNNLPIPLTPIRRSVSIATEAGPVARGEVNGWSWRDWLSGPSMHGTARPTPGDDAGTIYSVVFNYLP